MLFRSLTTGFFENNDRLNNVLDCLPPRQTEVLKILKRYCAKVEGIPVFGEYGYGGEDWQKNDVTTIALRNADDKYVAIGIEKGYIIPFNLAVFDSSRIEYKQALAEIDRLTSLSGKARAAAATKRDSSIALAKSTRETSLTNLNEEFEFKILSKKVILENFENNNGLDDLIQKLDNLTNKYL